MKSPVNAQMIYDLKEISQDGVICILDDPICAILLCTYFFTFPSNVQ